jgi:AcrR family transcriptional regulator
MVVDVPYPVPIPGSAPARLIEAAILRFESEGRDAVNVMEVARDAGVTTGSLYHHFGSKEGLYIVIRDEMERRMTERMEGAAAAVGSTGRPAVTASLLVAFDAALRFGVARILSEPALDPESDAISLAIVPLLPPEGAGAAPALAGAWRGALGAVAEGSTARSARDGLVWALGGV